MGLLLNTYMKNLEIDTQPCKEQRFTQQHRNVGNTRLAPKIYNE
jgi:hypothetical protein